MHVWKQLQENDLLGQPLTSFQSDKSSGVIYSPDSVQWRLLQSGHLFPGLHTPVVMHVARVV